MRSLKGHLILRTTMGAAAILLDEPVVPEYKSRPKRLLNILITTAAAFILFSVFLVLNQRRRTYSMNT